MGEKQRQATPPPGAPKGVFCRPRSVLAWPFSRLWTVSDPTLFQVSLVAALLVTVLGKCRPPPSFPFAFPINELNQTEFKTGDAVRYDCLPGYRRTNLNSVVTCGSTGQWLNAIVCVKKVCSNPGDLPNGQVEIKTDLSFGSQIEFSCSEGYILIGSSTSYCEITDRGMAWSDPLPECVIAKCEAPPDISNGKHNGGEEDLYTYGSSVTYSCNPTFSLLGSASISCTVVNKTVGVWSPNPPACERILCSKPDVPHGMIVSGLRPTYMYKDSILFACQKGSVLRGDSLIHCDVGNKWSPSLPTCEISSCINVPDIPHASWVYPRPSRGGVYEAGTVLRYQCHRGYEPATPEPTTVTCLEDFRWSQFKGCKRICCPISEIKNIRILQPRKDYPENGCVYFYGDRVTYSCNDKPISATCKADGKWEPRTPSCPPTVCLKPEIGNGKLSVEKDQYVEQEKVTIHCDAGFALLGSQNITCSKNRTWYPEVPKCERATSEGCEQVFQGWKLMRCLPNPADVKMALEVYKLSVEIVLLEQQRDKERPSIRGSPP